MKTDRCAFLDEEEGGCQSWSIEYLDGYYLFVNAAQGDVMQAAADKNCMANTKNRQTWEKMIVSPVTLSGSYFNIPPRY